VDLLENHSRITAGEGEKDLPKSVCLWSKESKMSNIILNNITHTTRSFHFISRKIKMRRPHVVKVLEDCDENGQSFAGSASEPIEVIGRLPIVFAEITSGNG